MLCAADPLREARDAVDEIEADRTADHLSLAVDDNATVAVLGWPCVVGSALVRRGDVEVLVIDAMGQGSSFARVLEDHDLRVGDVAASGLGAAVASADLVVLEAAVASGDEFIAAAGSRAAAAVARANSTPVWLVVGVGRVLPDRVWQALIGRLDLAEPWELDEELVPLDLVDRVVGPAGLEDPATLRSRIDCPIAPELFRPDIT